MTIQSPDFFRYGNTTYALDAVSDPGFFDVSDLNLPLLIPSSAHWRGYGAVFAVTQSRLVLDQLNVKLACVGEGENQTQPITGPTINGVMPSPPEGWLSLVLNSHYQGLSYQLNYSGGLLLGHGCVPIDVYTLSDRELHPAFRSESVIEMIFEGGRLTQEFDRSEPIATLRATIADRRKKSRVTEWPTREEVIRLVDDVFSRNY